jgi:hypothetical protein
VSSEDDLYVPEQPPPLGSGSARFPWARPSTPIISKPEVLDDAPATEYAYTLLHVDLDRLHLTERGP